MKTRLYFITIRSTIKIQTKNVIIQKLVMQKLFKFKLILKVLANMGINN